ncbi:MAG: pyridoxal phosphate-dependent aminotransferase [Candidatus Aenigmatarchaeota archaeon]|nr:MAG: pyridoxal phosphate-dependent aminotransferase [Candidatus Aenigmarchaeota archaeon]
MVRPRISKRQVELPGANIVRLLKIAEEDREIISFGPGEPDFSAPEHIREAVKKAMDSEMTHYSPASGRSELKEAIIRKLRKENGINAGDENIIVTCGSMEGIFLSLAALIDPGEEVLVPDPGFLGYMPTVEILNGYPVSVRLSFENGFDMDGDTIRESIKDPERVKAMIINTPSNPTGTVLRKRILEEIAEVAVENDIVILSDEAYEKLIYGERHVSIGSLNGMEDYVITFHSFSKTFAMPGFRLGYACGPEDIIKAMVKLHPYTTVCAPTMSQIAGAEALTNKESERCIEEMRRSYDERRKLILKRVREIEGFDVLEPRGAFYLFPRFNYRMKSVELCEYLLDKAKVAVVPGSDFGRYGEGFIRLSYATSLERIKEGMKRMKSALEELR